MSIGTLRKKSAKSILDRAIHAALRTSVGRDPRNRTAFYRLLGIARRVRLVRIETGGGRTGITGLESLVRGLLALASFHKNWLRSPELADLQGLNPRRQFTLLARHLLADYPVPEFMTSVWLAPLNLSSTRHKMWFVHIGTGKNIRTAKLPIAYTKRMAHEFLDAPAHLTVEQALRWGQIRGLGGSKELALAILQTRLGKWFRHEGFWITVIHFFINHPKMDLIHVAPIVEYLYGQKYVDADVLMVDGDTINIGPPQPALTMKGRTPEALLRQIDAWNAKIKRPRRLKVLTWKPASIGGFQKLENEGGENERVWTIQELTNSLQLKHEGDAMNHCVGTYVSSCMTRTSSIWSMRFMIGGRAYRVMTIEIELSSRTICQAKRRGNSNPNEKSLNILRQWAKAEGLKISYWNGEVQVQE